MRHTHYEEFLVSKFFFTNHNSAIFWLIVRLYVGYTWVMAGFEKLINPLWFGNNAGAPLTGFIQGALGKTTGMHPDVYMWYASFLQNFVLTHVVMFSNMVAVGEFLVGIALITGLFVGISAFFGAFMNFNYLLAGTVSINPMFFFLGILLVLAWRTAGYIGLDYYALPKLHQLLKRP